MTPSTSTKRSSSDLAVRTRQPTHVLSGTAWPPYSSLPCGRIYRTGGISEHRVRTYVDSPPGEARREAGVLPFLADRKGELVVRHGHARHPSIAVNYLYMRNPCGRQGIPDKLRRIVRPVDDVDLLTVQL